MPDFDSTIWDNLRIYTVDFGRAKSGAPNRNYPEVDSVGYHDAKFPDEHGPITSSVVGLTEVNVQFYRTEISLKAKLFAISADPSVLQIVQPASGELTGQRSETIQFKPVKAGRTTIEIHYNWADGPVLGRLYVQIYDPLHVRLAIHLVSIVHTDSAGKITVLNLPDRFLGADCPDTASKQQRARYIFSLTNETWLPHGIVIESDPHAASYGVWGATELGDDPLDLTDMRARIVIGGARSANRVASHVNVYCVPCDLGAILAVTHSGIESEANNLRVARDATPGSPTFSLSGIYLNSVYDAIKLQIAGDPDVVASHALAHELGHYMMASPLGGPKHCTGDHPPPHGGPEAFRDDTITRRRLLYPEASLPTGSFTPWRKDTGYGDTMTGAFVTHRALPAAQDVTFEESNRARASIRQPNFYV
ncbi:MAG TPA: hypothetical protein VML19_12415, partial [Verrucomicrobiae bacterium]|nr:hypothetical protein [Verrucomicrobiae bacterium]